LENIQNSIPKIKHVGILYLISMALFVITNEVLSISGLDKPDYFLQMILIVIIQIAFVFVPTFIYIVWYKPNLIKTFKINKISFKNIILSILIMLFAMPIAGMLNAIIILILNFFGIVNQPLVFETNTINQLYINIFVVALIPAIFEEIAFRGVIFKAYEKLGTKKAIVISAFLFALMHINIQSLVGTFILGLVLAYLVYKTNSIFSSMIGHFTNNAFIVFITYISSKPKVGNPTVNTNILEQISGFEPTILFGVLIVILMFFILVVGLFGGMIFLLNHTTRNISRISTDVEIKSNEKVFNEYLLISFVLVIYVFVMQIL